MRDRTAINQDCEKLKNLVAKAKQKRLVMGISAPRRHKGREKMINLVSKKYRFISLMKWITNWEEPMPCEPMPGPPISAATQDICPPEGDWGFPETQEEVNSWYLSLVESIVRDTDDGDRKERLKKHLKVLKAKADGTKMCDCASDTFQYGYQNCRARAPGLFEL